MSPREPGKRALSILSLTVFCCVASLGTYLALNRSPTSKAADIGINGTALLAPLELEPFELIDGNEKPFAASDFRGSWSFVYFGYTFCADACPLALNELARLRRLLAVGCDGLSDRYVFVSVDPARDTPARLREYAAYFDEAIIGLSGPTAEIDKFAHRVGARYTIPDGQDNTSYHVDHSSTVFLIDPEGRFHATFKPPHHAAEMERDFKTVLARHTAQRAEPETQCAPSA